MSLPPSVLTKSQRKVYGPRFFTEDGHEFRITATVRHDDECGNGHNSFAITGTIDVKQGWRWVEHSSGCIHEDIAIHFPELAPFIKWHLVSTDGPMHYVENTIYHTDQHGPNAAWIYYSGPNDPLGLGTRQERLLCYAFATDAKRADGVPDYRVVWDTKTAKTANLQHARSSAVWPEATDEELSRPPEELKAILLARLPALMEDFKKAVESLGLQY